MSESKYQVWIDNTWFVGHISVGENEDENDRLDHAYRYARATWSEGVQRNQVSVCKV
jgi:hypothetical protein